MTELLYKDEVYRLMGAAFEVYNELGCGFLESVYQEALERELRSRDIPFESQCILRIRYKTDWLVKCFNADLVCFDGKILVEIKALDRLTGREEAQLLNYMKATGIRVGILINFRISKELEWKRFVR